MIVSMDCETARRIATWEHRWLGRGVIPIVRERRDNLHAVLASIPAKLEEIERTLNSALDGYSPKNLVDRPPLTDLPPYLRSRVGDAVHAAYLAANVVQPGLAKALDAVRGLRNATTNSQLPPALDKVLAAAEKLQTALEQLPKGFFLP